MSNGLLPSLNERIWFKGQSFNREEILALLAGDGIGPAPSGSVFTVEVDDDNYEEVGINAVVTDLRLKGKTGYPVYTTQNNIEFRKADLTYSAADGTVTIANFNLQAGEHLTIFAMGAETPGDFSSVMSRLTVLEQLTAPMKGGRIVMVWDEPDLTLSPPAPWVEVTDYTGRVLVGRDGSTAGTAAGFNTVGNVGGEVKHTLTIPELPVFSTKMPANTDNVPPGTGEPSGATYPYRRTTTVQSDAIGGGIPHNVMNPFRVVRYIRYDR